MTVLEYIQKSRNAAAQMADQEAALKAILNTADVWSNNAASGYAATAAAAIGLTDKQTSGLISAMQEAFERMTTEEAESVFCSKNF